MNRRSLLAVSLCAVAWVTPVAGADEPPPSKLAGFEPFIGQWNFTDEFLAENAWAKDFHAEIMDWGTRRNIVHLRETVHRSDPKRVVFEGLAYWHPTEDRLEYTGYNVQERFLFEGEIVELTAERLVKEYRVHYPPGYVHDTYPEVKGDVREYRGERRLLDANTMEHRTWMRIGGEWRRWPADDAKPFVTRRVAD